MKRAMPILRGLLMIVLMVLLELALAMPVGKYISNPGPDTPAWAWAMAHVLYPTFVLLALVMTRLVDRRPVSDLRLGFDAQARKATLWGSVVGVGSMLLFVGLTQVTGIVTWHWNAGFQPLTALLMALLLAGAGPGEEFLFRGYMLNTLEAYGTTAAVVISTLLFTAVHTITGRTSPVELLSIFLHGLFYALLTLRSRSIWPATIIHALYDGTSTLIWTGNATYSLWLPEVAPGWIKLAFKACMFIPFMLVLWGVYGKQKQATASRKAA